MDRRKKIVNFHEGVTHKLLSAAAQKNEAKVYTKIRIADVLNIDGSGLDNDHFGYALKAHFDFVVAGSDDVPLFAIEFDGPHHDRHERSKLNDRRKNLICERLSFPLARVRDEHLFQTARGVDYLTWLTELWFAFQALVEAQEQGMIPRDDPIDPMMFLSNPNIEGRFPLFISLDARIRLQHLHESRVLGAPIPCCFCGVSPNESAVSLVVIPTARLTFLVALGSMYLSGFGVAPSEAADELAVVNLARLAEKYLESQQGAVSQRKLRDRLCTFLRQNKYVGGFSGMGVDFGFSVLFEHRDGKGRWTVGPIGDEAVVEIKVY